jgi:predicted MFS family arabinose efflux permease
VPPWTLYGPWQRWGFLSILFLITTSNYYDYYILSVVLDPIKREFHVSDSMLGLLSGFCFALSYALAALPIARWADRGNRRTVITVALAGWSIMTAACGLAQSFGQLLLARLAVGAAEPGAVPPSQSLIADYFPPERRATALTIMSQWGAAAGGLLGIGLGGYIAATQGWRMAFIWAGLPGLMLAAIVRIKIPEPRSRLGFPVTGLQAESVTKALMRLRGKRSFLYMLGGFSIFMLSNFAIAVFVPSFIIRSFHASLEQATTLWGVDLTVADMIGALAGGWLADRLSQKDIRWYAWLPAIAFGLGMPLYGLALSAHDLWTFIAIVFPGEAILALGVAVVYPAIHVVCGNRRRVMAIAVLHCSCMFFGGGFGPLAAGALSDAFGSAYGNESLRYSLISMLSLLIPAAAAFYWAARAIRTDREDA